MTAQPAPNLTLPQGIHTTTLTARDARSGAMASVIALWTDRPFDRCPRCGQPVQSETVCPVGLNGGAEGGPQVQAISQQHGCGEWLDVLWRTVAATDGGPVDPQAVTAAATELRAELDRRIEQEGERQRGLLVEDLSAALRRLAEPLERGETREDREQEITTGSDTAPGIYHDGNGWLAWDYYGPGSADLMVTVTETELPHADPAVRALSEDGWLGAWTDPVTVADLENAVRLVRRTDASTVERLSAFAAWVVSLDDPSGPGAEQRRTVTLAAIIDRARGALGPVEQAEG